MVSAIAFGVSVWHRIEKNKRIEASVAQANQLGAANAEFRQRLGVIRSTKTPSMKDFYFQCLAMERLNVAGFPKTILIALV